MTALGSRLEFEGLDLAATVVSGKTIWLFLRVRSKDGFAGFGEATLYGEENAIVADVAHARKVLSARACALPGEALQALAMVQPSPARRAVINALEQGLIDLMARRSGVSVCVLLGGPYRRMLPAYANINRGIADRTPAGFAAQAKRIVSEHGYEAVKIAPFDGVNWQTGDPLADRDGIAAGIDRILAVRDAIGSSRKLMVDCHWRLTPLQAQDVLRACTSANLYWLEDALDDQCFDAAAFRAVRTVAHHSGVRIAGGERAATLSDLSRLAALGGIDTVLPDLRTTGVRHGMAMLEFAASAGLEASLHNPVGPVLDAMSIQVAAALPSFTILEGQVGESDLFDTVAGERLPLVDGRRPLPAGVGTGIDPRLDFDGDLPDPAMMVADFAGKAGAGPNG